MCRSTPLLDPEVEFGLRAVIALLVDVERALSVRDHVVAGLDRRERTRGFHRRADWCPNTRMGRGYGKVTQRGDQITYLPATTQLSADDPAVEQFVVAGLPRQQGRALVAFRSSQRRWYPEAWDRSGDNAENGESHTKDSYETG